MTLPCVPILQSVFVNARRTSPKVLLGLSVKHSMIVIIPPGPYPSYRAAEKSSPDPPFAFSIALSITWAGT